MTAIDDKYAALGGSGGPLGQIQLLAAVVTHFTP
jgi:hypothetical protein